MEHDSEVVRRLLVERFPNLFMGKGRLKIPLAIGIDKELFRLMPDISRKRIRSALHNYTSGPLYLKTLVAGQYRYGIDGHPAGIVTPEQADHAKERLRAMSEQKRKRREPLKQAA